MKLSKLGKQAVATMVRWVPDKPYLKLRYRLRTGHRLDLNNPRTFNGKIQWLKLNDRNPLYTTMVDKFEAKKYVADIIGEKYIIPTYGVWNRAEDIDFSKLPDRFVLKCTHDSGGIVVCKDKNTLDRESCIKFLDGALKSNFYYISREWEYRDVKPRIIAEKYMEDNVVNDLRDYKIHCFNGKPMFIQVIGNRNFRTHTGNQMFYTFKWKKANWAFADYPPFENDIEKPQCLREMYEIAKKLSAEMAYVRIDLYEINHHVYFGEITPYPSGGFYRYKDPYTYKTDKMLGRLIDLSAVNADKIK